MEEMENDIEKTSGIKEWIGCRILGVTQVPETMGNRVHHESGVVSSPGRNGERPVRRRWGDP